MWERDSDKRFERIYQQVVMSVMEIWVDTQTGVNYLFHQGGEAGGMTPLLDKDGKVVVSEGYPRYGTRL